MNVEKYLDAREGDVMYPYRHLWENARDELGWTDNRNASYVGGWTTQRMGGSQGEAYRKLNPHHMLAIMEGQKVTEVIAESDQAERRKRILTSDSHGRAEDLLRDDELHTPAHTRVA